MSSCAPREVDPRGKPRSGAARWRIRVLLLVHALIAVHIAHWWTTGRTISPLEPSEAMEFTKYGVVNAGLIFFGLTAISTLVLGRFFCGWGCHLVALQDLCRWLLLRAGIRPRPLRSRTLALVPLLAFGYMFLLPLWSRHDTPQTSVALTTSDFWSTFPPWWGALLTFFVCGFLTVYILGSKGFCTYACPYGALFGAVDRLATGRIRVNEACEGCGLCTATCSSNVEVKREVATYGMVVDSGCMKCMDCVSVCPKDALSFGFGPPALARSPLRPGKGRTLGEEAMLALTFAATFFAVRGLYGVVPFLLALGAASTVAGVCLWAWRRGGRWLPIAAVTLALVTHSGAVQWLGGRSSAAFQVLEHPRAVYFSGERQPLDAAGQAAAEEVIRNGERALSLSLLPDPRREVEVGWARLLTGDLESFQLHLARAAAAQRQPATSLLEMGNLQREGGDLEQALARYQEALTVAPNHEFAGQMLQGLLVQIGDSYLAAGQPELAEPHMARALELEPEALSVRAALVELALARGSEERAIRLLEGGVAIAPEDPAPLRVMAFTFLQLRKLDRARAACERAAKFPDPTGETARLTELIAASK